MRSRSLYFSLLAATLLMLATGDGWIRAADEPSGFVLDDGLKVRLFPLRGEKKVVVLLAVRAGFFDEPPDLPHLAHVAEHLVVFGSPAGSEEADIVRRWYEQGRVNGETLPGWMYFDLHVPPEQLETALSVQARRLARPEFTDVLLAREVPRALGELEFLEQSETGGTGKLAFCAFVQAALHGRGEAPIKAATRRFTVEDVRRFHARTFRPDRAILCVIGDFDADLARKVIGDAFGAIPKPQGTSERPGLRAGDKDRTVRWDARTRHLILAWATPPATSPEHAALSVAAEAFSARLSSDRELAASVKLPMATNDVEGLFLVNVQVKPGADLDSLKANLLERVGRLSTPEGFVDGQIAPARQGLLRALRPSLLRSLFPLFGGTPLLRRTNQELQRVNKEIAWGDVDAYAGRVEALDGAAVRAAIARHLSPEEAVVFRVIPSE